MQPFAAATAQSFAVAQSQGTTRSLAAAVAVASTDAAAADTTAAATALAQTAQQAVSKGVTGGFAESQALALAAASAKGVTQSYATAVASAIKQGGTDARDAYAQSFATAIAAGGAQKAGLAQATAAVLCQGGAEAEAYAEALSIAIGKDPKTRCDGALCVDAASALGKRGREEGRTSGRPRRLPPQNTQLTTVRQQPPHRPQIPNSRDRGALVRVRQVRPHGRLGVGGVVRHAAHPGAVQHRAQRAAAAAAGVAGDGGLQVGGRGSWFPGAACWCLLAAGLRSQHHKQTTRKQHTQTTHTNNTHKQPNNTTTTHHQNTPPPPNRTHQPQPARLPALPVARRRRLPGVPLAAAAVPGVPLAAGLRAARLKRGRERKGERQTGRKI